VLGNKVRNNDRVLFYTTHVSLNVSNRCVCWAELCRVSCYRDTNG